MAKVFITGSSDGLGLLSAKALVSMGHQVVIHARNEDRAKSAIKEVPGAEKAVIGDLSSMEETKRIAKHVNELGTFDAIIHNAGINRVPDKAKSIDGLPLVFAVNSIAPYILTAMINRPQRLIYLSSGMHMYGDASVERLTAILEGRNIPSYSDTKLHDLLMALVVARKWPEVSSNAVNPGWVPTKMGGRGAPDDLNEGFGTQIWLAVGQDESAKLSGRYLFHKKEMNFNPQAKMAEIQDKFLSVCDRITGISFNP
jgi:NAD(P)-dependent dehydrogenase (short-subunit alcohol dehydrogenase family)